MSQTENPASVTMPHLKEAINSAMEDLAKKKGIILRYEVEDVHLDVGTGALSATIVDHMPEYPLTPHPDAEAKNSFLKKAELDKLAEKDDLVYSIVHRGDSK